jgi:hypothetical protein
VSVLAATFGDDNWIPPHLISEPTFRPPAHWLPHGEDRRRASRSPMIGDHFGTCP